MFRQIPDVVKNLLIINVIMYVLFQVMKIMNPYLLAMYYPTSDFFQPFQIVTHMFMHASSTHLLFNMIGLYFFGPPLEQLWGGKRFLIFYLIAGLGSLLLYLLTKYIEFNYLQLNPGYVDVPMLGASGAVFGLLAGFAMKYPNQIISLIFPPISMKAKYFVLGYAAIELFLGVGRVNTGIAHFAHLGGALFGVLLILYWNKTDRRFRR